MGRFLICTKLFSYSYIDVYIMYNNMYIYGYSLVVTVDRPTLIDDTRLIVLQCPQRSYADWKKCRKHMRTVHSGKEFSCNHCDKVFSRPDKLRLHISTHSEYREFVCETCGKQFARVDKVSNDYTCICQISRFENLSCVLW